MRVEAPIQPAVRGDLVYRQVDEDFFVYDPVSDKVALLNVSAAVILDLCDGTRTSDEIVLEVARTFKTERAGVTNGVRETLALLADSGLLRSGSISK
jgi:hypothetical protein